MEAGGRRRCHRCGFVTAAAAAFLLSLPFHSRRAASTRRGGGSRGGDGGGAEGGGGSERRASAHTPVISLHSRVAAEAGPLGFNYLNVGPLLRHASGMRRDLSGICGSRLALARHSAVHNWCDYLRETNISY